VTTGSNCFPSVLVSIWNRFHEGKVAEAEELHYKLLPIIDLMRRRNDVRISKEALDLMGVPVGAPRRPLSPATKADRKELEKILSDLNLI
jgi:4-hydroxy-tetrahydrodipicolinate synthase